MRWERKWTVAQAAAHLGVSEGSVSYLESSNNQPSRRMVWRVRRAFPKEQERIDALLLAHHPQLVARRFTPEQYVLVTAFARRVQDLPEALLEEVRRHVLPG
jgi:hypothetical protein